MNALIRRFTIASVVTLGLAVSACGGKSASPTTEAPVFTEAPAAIDTAAPDATLADTTVPDTTVADTTAAPTTIEATTTTAPNKTMAEIAAANPDLSTFVKLLKKAGLTSVLSRSGHYTVFAPTNDAFAKLPKTTLVKLQTLVLRSRLIQILQFHVIDHEILAANVTSGYVKTIEGHRIRFRVRNGNVTLTDNQGRSAKLVQTDLIATNGVIHTIDLMLLPRG